MTPACSTCGHVVEWVRTLYQAKWRLFRGHPEVLTEGRYYLADARATHYPGWHNLGSADWTRNYYDPPKTPILGEAFEEGRSYRKSQWPALAPASILVGSDDCVSGGSVFPVPLTVRTLFHGVDSRCWSQAHLEAPYEPETNMFKLSRLTRQGLAIGQNRLLWETAPSDLDAWWLSASPGFVVCPFGKDGWYYFYANVGFIYDDAAQSARFSVLITKNSNFGQIYAYSQGVSAPGYPHNITLYTGALIPVSAYETVEVTVYATHCANPQTEIYSPLSGDTVPSFGAFRIRDL